MNGEHLVVHEGDRPELGNRFHDRTALLVDGLHPLSRAFLCMLHRQCLQPSLWDRIRTDTKLDAVVGPLEILELVGILVRDVDVAKGVLFLLGTGGSTLDAFSAHCNR